MGDLFLDFIRLKRIVIGILFPVLLWGMIENWSREARRNSGIESAIQRPDAEIFQLDHSVYFPLFE